MAKIESQFIQAKTKSGFESALSAGNVSDTSIAFIEDEQKIWAKGKYYNMIPADGHERQILSWKADGEAQWEDLSNVFTGMEELLAYGVEWEDNVSDPHLTRIGNMALHKSLPIQSQLKGCIAQADKIIYWLNESDWRFKKDPSYKTVDLSTAQDVITLDSVDGLEINQYVKADTAIGKITAINALTITVEWDLEDTTTISAVTSLEIGSRLDGYDGTVRVYCPGFYIKSTINGSTRRVWLSTVKIDNTWTYQPEILLDAYRSTVLNTVPENMGYLSTLTVGCAISVVNTAAYCRGGGNKTGNDKYLTGADDTPIDIFRTDLGKPRTAMSRPTMRNDARAAGSEMLSYDQYKNIFYWLYVVEYANFNCQEAYNEALTDEGYKQGGLGAGITNMGNCNEYNAYYPLTPCGYGNEIGNRTGIKSLVIPEFTYGSGSIRAAQTLSMPRWRGFDNPFGDIWTNLDGIIIQGDAEGNPKTVYTTTDPNNYGDNEAAKNAMEIAGHEIHQNGYTKEFDLGEAAHIIPESVGGDTTKYKCDYHQTGSRDNSLRTLLVGGGANTGSSAGLGDFDSNVGVSDSTTRIGFRSVSRFVSFSQSE